MVDDLDTVVEGLSGRPATLLQLEHALRGRGAAVLILILSVPFILPIPVPLLATVCGVPMVVMGLRMMIAKDGRLPRFAHRHELSSDMIRRIAKGLRKLLKPVAFLYRPRLGVIFWPVSWRLTGLSIFLAAFMLSLPIPIPFANMIPAIGLIHLAAGLIQRDGLAILVGHAFTLGAYLYLYFIWDTAIEILSKLIS